MSDGLLVIGSGPAGLAAAKSYRDNDGAGPVCIVTSDLDLPYNRPPLSKDFLRGETAEDELALEQAAFYAEHDIEVRLGHSVVGLDPAARTATLEDGDTLAWDELVIATGVEPTPLPVPGADRGRVFQLRSLAHARDLRSAAAAASAVVIGSGFIGCEAAASLRQRGLAVTLITNEDRPHQARLGDAVARRISDWLTSAGVALVLGAEITALDHDEDARVTVRMTGHEPVTADFAVLATGIRPNADQFTGGAAEEGAADSAGLGTVDGRIVVDAQLRTNRAHVYAAGDVAAAHNVTAGRQVVVEHWGDAEAMGEIAGANAAGAAREWDAVPGFWSEIGEHTLKYTAWGDGFDDVRFVSHPGGGFTAWYLTDDRVVGVLTSEADDDYERGEKLVADRAPADDIDTPTTDAPTTDQ